MSAPFSRRHRKRKLKADINVVPYIDVMLVLLIIFMVTAPLLNLGVDIKVPKADAKPLQQEKDPIIVSVYADGRYALKLKDAEPEQLDVEGLKAKLAAYVRQDPDMSVIVAGDASANYGEVYQVLAVAQSAGVTRFAMLSRPAEK